MHGVATLVKVGMSTRRIAKFTPDDSTKWIANCITNDLTVVNVYNPLHTSFKGLLVFQHADSQSGDFNCHHTSQSYRTNNDNFNLIVQRRSETTMQSQVSEDILFFHLEHTHTHTKLCLNVSQPRSGDNSPP